jgi:tetratricopeptide (TPR) repeat protein
MLRRRLTTTLLSLALTTGCATTPARPPVPHDEAEAHYQRAYALGREDPTAALAEAEAATALAPERSPYWRLVATLHLQREQPTEARAAIDRALALAPDDAQSWVVLGLLTQDTDEADRALEAFEKARALAPTHALAHFAAGQLHLRRGALPAALACFQRAAALEPRNWRARAALVQVHQALGQRAERDAAHEALLTLYREGRVDEPFFVRDQWHEGERRVVVVENLELTGEWARRYEFQVYAPGAERPQLVLALGSSDLVNQLARERNPAAPRLFHLDGYEADGTHCTYGFFEGEPSYDDTRARVLAILHGEVVPTSRTKSGPPSGPP